jgi:predicted restriction endonuclease
LGYSAVLRKVRRQEVFKRQLLSIERECALSGESEQSVLDAAHIKEVKRNGGFSPDNGFLLRADVHRLFDKGLLVIDPESGKASLTKDVPEDSPYQQQVDGWQLRSSTLGRVRASLLVRYKNGRLTAKA